MAKKDTLFIGGLLTIGAWALLRKPVPVVSGLGEAEGLVSKIPYEEVVGTIRRIARDLYGQITRATELTGTPSWVINAISAHEIRWKPYTFINPAVKATGPMQMTPPTMFDTYYFALKWKLVSPQLEGYMRTTLGAKYDKFVSLAKDRQSDKSFAKFLLNPQFNIVMGALLLRCLMVLFSENGIVNQAKLALGYNRGIGYATKKLVGADTRGISAGGLLAKAPGPEARAYINDMVGAGGFFEQVRSSGI